MGGAASGPLQKGRQGCVLAQDGKAEAQVQIEALESAKPKLERKLSALTAKSSALKEANAAQAVTLEGLQASLCLLSTHLLSLLWDAPHPATMQE